MDILSALRKVTASIKTWADSKLETKLDKNLGTDNAGKVLTIGDDGNIKSQMLDTGIIVLSGTNDNPINIDEIKVSGTYLIKGVVTTSMDTTSGSDSAKLNKTFIDGFTRGELMSIYSLQDGFVNQLMMNPTRPLVRLDSGEGYSDAIDASYVQPVEKTTEMTQPVGIRSDGQLFTEPFNQVQSDWNQNDKKQLDYVKNRTHYKMVAHNSGYMADLMDSTHNIGDIVLLRAIPMPILDSIFIPGINASYRSEYAFHFVFKITFYEGTDVYESENDKECIANEEIEISEFSTGNIKVLYHNKREPIIALYIIYDLTTLSDEDKTKFAKTGIYAQLVSLNTYDTATSILVGYRSIKYIKLHSKYIDIPVATNDVAGVVKPVSKTDEMTQPVGVDENGVLFAKQAQTDWDQKDDTAADYLKNRPFGEGFPEDLGTYNFTATSETTITYFIAQDDGSNYVITHLFNHKDISNATQVVINGETDLWTSSYDGKGHVNASGDKFSFHGYLNTGNTATITSNANIFTTGNTYPVLFRDVSDDSIKKIGLQYIPNSVYTFENAPVKFGSGYKSTVQGGGTTASGADSHAEGCDTTASGHYSHAEGYTTTASGSRSHAEGNYTTASGDGSHAEGFMTRASSKNQHVQGVCNVEDSAGVYAHIVGNGTIRDRRNIHALDWNGNAWYAGDVYVGSTSGTNKDAGSKKLATEEYVGAALTVDGEDKYALKSHIHQIGDVTGLQNELNAKALATDISSLETTVAGKADKATTLEGYGITDAYTKTEADTKIADAVKYSEQTLTEEQQAQARTNIGAVSVGEVPEQVQADHSQNDRTKHDFIKNRTHYQYTLGDIGYPVEFMDGTHNVGDIVLLRDSSKNELNLFYIPGINAPYTETQALYLKFKVTYSGGTYTIDRECKDTVVSDGSPIIEINEISSGNIKALYYSSRQPYIAWYFIADLTTLNDEDKTAFTKTGIYAQVVNDLDSASSIQIGCYIKQYVKLDSKYIDIPVATNDVAGVVKPVSKTDEMTQPVGVDENGALFTTEQPGGSGDGDMQKSVYDPNNRAKDIFKYAEDISKLAVTNHALSDTAHTDIRELITGLTNRLNALADSDDETLDQLSEIVAYIKSNKSLIDAITTGKVSVSDIVDNLTTDSSDKPLSAAQGKALKALIDAIVIPDKLPNPNALTFSGAVTGRYDGSTPLTVNIPSVETSGSTVGYPVVSMTASSTELTPNTYYRWGEIAALTVTLAEPTHTDRTNEYCFEFVSGGTPTTLSVPDTVKWVKPPVIEVGKTYQVSILNGIGVICGA